MSRVHWQWTNERYYRRTASRLRRCKSSRVLNLPATPNAPMFGFLTGLFMEALALHSSPFEVNTQYRDQRFLTEAEKFLQRHEGADLDDTLLLELTIFRVGGELGWKVDEPVVFFWMHGTVGASSPEEWPIDAHYYADRLLFQTELNHGCTLE